MDANFPRSSAGLTGFCSTPHVVVLVWSVKTQVSKSTRSVHIFPVDWETHADKRFMLVWTWFHAPCSSPKTAYPMCHWQRFSRFEDRWVCRLLDMFRDSRWKRVRRRLCSSQTTQRQTRGYWTRVWSGRVHEVPRQNFQSKFVSYKALLSPCAQHGRVLRR